MRRILYIFVFSCLFISVGVSAHAQLKLSTTSASTYNVLYQLFSTPSTNTVYQEPQMINAQEPQMINAQEPQMRTLSGSIYYQEPQMRKINPVYQEPQM